MGPHLFLSYPLHQTKPQSLPPPAAHHPRHPSVHLSVQRPAVFVRCYGAAVRRRWTYRTVQRLTLRLESATLLNGLNGLRLYCAFLPSGHSKGFRISPHVHPFMLIFTDCRRCQPRRATAGSSGAVVGEGVSLRDTSTLLLADPPAGRSRGSS